MKGNNKQIEDWIDDYQDGKSGIYPIKVIEMVQLQFAVDYETASTCVLNHIRKILHESERGIHSI